MNEESNEMDLDRKQKRKETKNPEIVAEEDH